MTTKQTSASKTPPKMPGGLPLIGHMIAFGKNPFECMMTLRNKQTRGNW